MTTKELLTENIRTPIFSNLDVSNTYKEKGKSGCANIQISRMVKRGEVVRLKRGLFAFKNVSLDEFYVANLLYSPSYISMESALNYYGVIPDVPQTVTSVNTITTKKIKNYLGVFSYSKIRADLFFGYRAVKSSLGEYYFNIALPEKALLDCLYIKKAKTLEELRINFDNINKGVFLSFAKFYPKYEQYNFKF